MEKLKMHSIDIINDNVKKIGELFPECLTEIINDNDKLEKVIDFDKLKSLLSHSVAEGNKERYQFTWPDKAKARALANAPIEATLRPCREESVNFDTTENLYIEGDNLDVLKLLRETYYGKVKMIYIDPPYNTGNDFVYEDDFSQDAETYKANSGQYDNQGNRLQKNQDTNGRFHTDWLNMMYPRLKVARDLLSDDGVIFISIDDNEQENLKKISEEVFGRKNFVAQLVWEKKKKGAFLSKNYINMKEYVLVYAKSNTYFGGLVGERTNEEETYPCIKTTNTRGIRVIHKGTPSKYKESNYNIVANTRVSSGNMELIFLDDLIVKDSVLQEDVRIDSNWIYSQSILDEYAQKKLLYITQDNYIRRIVKDERIKMLKDLLTREGSDGKSLPHFEYDLNLNNGGWGTNEDANDELHQLLKQQYLFDYSKPTRLIGKLVQTIDDKSATVMDFFSGSATTAHAIIKLNAEDGGKRKLIMVQIPEACDENSEAYKAGYKNVCEIGKERIRRAGEKILEEQKNKEGDLFSKGNSDLDVGFRVLKLDSSNMEDVYYHPEDLSQDELAGLISNIKEGRTDEDLLFQVMLDLGVLLSSKIEAKIIGGKKVFNVNKGYLIACFDENVDDDLITEVAKQKPTYFVMRDSSLANDCVSVNFDQIFEKYSPETTRKVL